MQNRYVGDIGDFGKYGLLRALGIEDDEPALSLGVVWCLHPDESRGDGKYTSYLWGQSQDEHALCDPELHCALRQIVDEERRDIAAVRASGILPAGTRYYEKPLHLGAVPAHQRAEARSRWLSDALEAVKGAQLVFLDPDNGLREAKHRAWLSPKHIRYDEVERFVERGQSVVVYHHLGREKGGGEIVRKLSRLKDVIRSMEAPFALHYCRGTARAYFVLPAPGYAEVLWRRAEAAVTGPWRGHFEPHVIT